jgi:hypothetical protein
MHATPHRCELLIVSRQKKTHVRIRAEGASERVSFTWRTYVTRARQMPRQDKRAYPVHHFLLAASNNEPLALELQNPSARLVMYTR